MTQIKAKIDEQEYTSSELAELKKNKPELFSTTLITVDQDFFDDLKDYCDDHQKHFDCLPVEFAWNGMLFDYDDFSIYLK